MSRIASVSAPAYVLASSEPETVEAWSPSAPVETARRLSPHGPVLAPDTLAELLRLTAANETALHVVEQAKAAQALILATQANVYQFHTAALRAQHAYGLQR